ncbi:cell envelope integrity protein TolA [Oleiagrimonas sp. C23AA]|uniref:cell envelope integrity protein TolA n=1 Tax=Oleiagrimonas sp. C23AA TaxID=2719047 RepID=UPI00141DCE49|nr:cell envelope integrity protein TolA [Oleiagrimonas sp. C23AA]NII09975.1 cell envelope integrity protein TolA [Oleiagrimonas sp. C23AA]
MDDRKATRVAVILAALLHVGLIAFLWLATLSCTTWENLFGGLNLPDGWNPVQCSKPLTMSGPVIEATLMGPAGAPPPKPTRHTSPKPKVAPPPPPKQQVHDEKPKPQPVKTLPPPPKQPDVKDQQKVVEQAKQKAEQAKRKQAEREKQHMSELQAQQQQDDIDKIFKQLNQAKKASQQAEHQSKLAQQKLAQLKDLKKNAAKDSPASENTPVAKKAQTGTNGPDQGLKAQYLAAIQSAVTQAWLRPDNIPPHVVCKVHITQIPGGQVINAQVDSSCPYDDIARRSIENAVMRAQPLPYHGFEKVFSRDLTLNFKVQN